MTAIYDQSIDLSSRMLRREISAVETYTQALGKFRQEPAHSLLRAIRAEHEDSSAVLRGHIDDLGADPVTSSGVRGQLARAFESVAQVFGQATSLMALEAGEWACVDHYLRILGDPDVVDEIKDDIRSLLLPRLQGHLDALRMLRAA